jgi:hypothetical protein
MGVIKDRVELRALVSTVGSLRVLALYSVILTLKTVNKRILSIMSDRHVKF